MAIGQPVTWEKIMAELTGVALDYRAAALRAKNLQTQLTHLQLTGLQNLSPDNSQADAQAVLNAGGYLSTLSGIYYGTATQAGDFNYDDMLGGQLMLWGGTTQ